MRPHSLGEVATLVGGRLTQGEPSTLCVRAEIDSRQVRQGDLFFCIPGERADGHDFVVQALEKGAVAAVIERPVALLPGQSRHGLIAVDSTIEALDALAASYRNELSTTVIGITGSVGKTSTKDLAAAVLSTHFSTYKNPGNLNSHIGLPLALLAMDGPREYALLEMAMRKRGEITGLCRTARPRIGILTDISASHIGVLGNIEEIALAKAELLERLPPEGLAFLDGDNAWVRKVSSRARCKAVFYGFGENCHYRGVNVRSWGERGTSFDVLHQGARFPFVLSIPGKHQVQNALAAAALGFELGLEPALIAEGLLRAVLSPMRLQVLQLAGFTVLDDAYNASPKSMKAALDLLGEVKGCRKVALLGGMLEMGEHGPCAHIDVGRHARKKADFLVTVGDLAKEIQKGWESDSFGQKSRKSCRWFPDKESAGRFLAGEVKQGDVWLIKASRGLGFEALVEIMKTLELQKPELNRNGLA